MDVDLPVWSIRPNWANGITETLEWLTDVSTSDTGTEQRAARRLTPRRSFEATYNPVRNERTFLGLMLDAFVAQPFYYPLWHDKARLVATAAAAATRVDFDNVYREFTDGGLALLYEDAFNFEVISIASQDDTGLNLAAPLDSTWSVRSVLYPLRKALMDPSSNYDALTSRVGQAQLKFTVNEANDYDEAFIGMMSYADRPIISIETDRADPLTVSYQRMIDELDNDTGLVKRNDLAGRSFAQQAQTWHIRGRQAHHEFRAMLYALRGRQKSVWLPTWNDDVFVSRDAAQGAVNLDIERVGYNYVGSGNVIPGKEYLWFKDQVLMVTAVGAAQSPQEDRLRIGGGLQAPLATGRSASFLQAARLDQDSVELHHETDNEGVMTCQAAFRTFNDNRDPTGIIYTPTPSGDMDGASCGSPEPGSCIRTFDGWYWHIQWKEMTSGGIQGDAAWCLVRDLNGNTIGNSESTSGHAYSNIGAPGGWQRDWKFSYDFPRDWTASIRTQYARDTDFGNISESCGDPTDLRPVVYIRAQHWTESDMHIIGTGCQGTLFPNDYGGPLGG